MTWVRTIPPDEAEGDVARCYRAMLAADGVVWSVYEALSLRPALLRGGLALSRGVFDEAPGGLPTAEREMIAVAVAAANECHY